MGGDPTEPGQYDAVVAVLADSGLCTGIIVSKTIILTAGHCLAGVELGDDVAVFWGDELDFSQPAPVVRWGVHPEFCADCDEDIYDYGFVEIGGEFLANTFIEPVATQEEWDATMQAGAEVILVGYGEDPDATDMHKGLGVKRSVTTKISRFSAQGLEFYAGGDDRDSCQGDSGGPAFVRLPDGSVRLAGITSRGSNPCGKGGYYGAPYAALCWLEQETGVDLRPGGCEQCDCLDTSPPEESRCSVERDADAPAPLLATGLVLVLVARRRRSAV